MACQLHLQVLNYLNIKFRKIRRRKMKLILLITLGLAQATFAQNFESEVLEKTIQPQQVKNLYLKIKEEIGDDKISEYLSPQQTADIEWYINQSSVTIDPHSPVAATPAAMLAGAAGGAAAAVVDYLWEKYVGEARSSEWERLVHEEGQFDLSQNQKNQPKTPVFVVSRPSYPNTDVLRRAAIVGGSKETLSSQQQEYLLSMHNLDVSDYLSPESNELIDYYTKNNQSSDINYEPIAGTPAALAGGAAGALAYKAVKWALNKVGGKVTNDLKQNPNQFDLSHPIYN